MLIERYSEVSRVVSLQQNDKHMLVNGYCSGGQLCLSMVRMRSCSYSFSKHTSYKISINKDISRHENQKNKQMDDYIFFPLSAETKNASGNHELDRIYTWYLDIITSEFSHLVPYHFIRKLQVSVCLAGMT